MNRSILIVICDFLLVSLLAFSSVDINKVADTSSERRLKLELATNQVDNTKDLAAVMRLALDEERKNRDQLLGELSKSREFANHQQALLTDQQAHLTEQQLRLSEQQSRLTDQDARLRDQQSRLTNLDARITAQQSRLSEQQSLLGEREKQIASFKDEILSREQQALRLQQDQASLQQRLAAAQTNLLTLNQQLHDSSVQSVVSGEKIAALGDLLRKQTDQAAALQQQLADLSKTNQSILSEKDRLANQLQLAETEKRLTADQLARMRDEVKAEREEKAKLAEGVKALASKSSELAREVRENRPLAPNTIFSEFVSNRVTARFSGIRAGFFGEATKARDTETVLATDGTNTFALCHVQDTPITLWQPGTDWEGFSGTLVHYQTSCPIHSISFCLSDPRVVLIPITPADIAQLASRAYRISPDPYKFQDAVLVGAKENYYGECRFEIDLSTPEYVKLDRNFLKGLFGKFNPSRGDLVFSRSGELLGVMANATYCMMIHSFDIAATFRFDQNLAAQHTGLVLSALYQQVASLPFKLQ
jgi:hypothetical protein